jgi:hypothetical protein
MHEMGNINVGGFQRWRKNITPIVFPAGWWILMEKPMRIYVASIASERRWPGTHEVGVALHVEGATQAPVTVWQPLETHLKNVAEMARGFAEVFGAGEWGCIGCINRLI